MLRERRRALLSEVRVASFDRWEKKAAAPKAQSDLAAAEAASGSKAAFLIALDGAAGAWAT